MTLYDKIVAVYPELTNNNDVFGFGIITLRNDADGSGDYIAEWNYEKPIPDGLKLGK